MLKLVNIKKTYLMKNNSQVALNGVSLNFEKGELVAIVGPSGCGKTTLLNIIGGLDRYTEGDLLINGKSTKEFSDHDWDSYRNKSIGFVFQNYNLINHISILDNVEMGMTLNNMSMAERRKKSLEVLKRVGLEKHLDKKPNQLSGGQKQRVAIARALSNDPEIILADEPTGALDSKTSVQIMNLIKEISGEKLVVMVTHNNEIAEQYATRTIRLKDGVVVNDSLPNLNDTTTSNYVLKKTSMSFFTALKLSFNNLRMKLARTLITSFAGSIGIIGVALVLAISTGFQAQIDSIQGAALSGSPITISNGSSFDFSGMMMPGNLTPVDPSTLGDFIYPYDPTADMLHENILNETYIEYVKNMDSSLSQAINYRYSTPVKLYTKDSTNHAQQISTSSINWAEIPNSSEMIDSQFEALKGTIPSSPQEVALVINTRNQIDPKLLTALGIKVNNEKDEKISFDEVLNKKIVIAKYNDYYTKVTNSVTNKDFYTIQQNNDVIYEKGIELTISGILRQKDLEAGFTALSSGINYLSTLMPVIHENIAKSNIIQEQKSATYNLLTGNDYLPDVTNDTIIKSLGANPTITKISIFPKDIETKKRITAYLDLYNVDKSKQDRIIYSDESAMISATLGTMVNGIAVVLVFFASISLFVSSIMIGIITYISVLERTKEIGILRSLGARKRDISNVFNAETFIIGLVSGLLGVIITVLLSFPINLIVENLTQLKNIATLNPLHALILIGISVVLTLIAGLFPSSIAAKKDPVEALRTE